MHRNNFVYSNVKRIFKLKTIQVGHTHLSITDKHDSYLKQCWGISQLNFSLSLIGKYFSFAKPYLKYTAK